MVPSHPGPTLAPQEVQDNITQYVPELSRLAEIHFRGIFNLDSANMRPHHWQKLAEIVFRELDQFDGFVIIHGTDSLTYTAAALSFMLRNLPKPVILTGSQRPLAEIRSDARANLIGAVELATYDFPEVCIFFGNELLRGNRSVKISSMDYGAFLSPNFPPLARVGVEVVRVGEVLKRGGDPVLETDISTGVVVMRIYPGFSHNHLKAVDENVGAIVIEGLGTGNIGSEDAVLLQALADWHAAGKVVVVNSQSPYGRVDLDRYQSGMLAMQAGAIGAGDMTTETTLVKLMHLLGNFPGKPESIRELLIVPLAGEISTPQ